MGKPSVVTIVVTVIVIVCAAIVYDVSRREVLENNLVKVVDEYYMTNFGLDVETELIEINKLEPSPSKKAKGVLVGDKSLTKSTKKLAKLVSNSEGVVVNQTTFVEIEKNKATKIHSTFINSHYSQAVNALIEDAMKNALGDRIDFYGSDMILDTDKYLDEFKGHLKSYGELNMRRDFFSSEAILVRLTPGYIDDLELKQILFKVAHAVYPYNLHDTDIVITVNYNPPENGFKRVAMNTKDLKSLSVGAIVINDYQVEGYNGNN